MSKLLSLFDGSGGFPLAAKMCGIEPVAAVTGAVGRRRKMSWIPCSERLPEDLTPVNITWTNHFPPDYYAHIKDVHFTYTGIFYKGKWYWWSAYAKDALAEYGNDEVDEMADEIEVLAWQPLPEPWKGEEK